MRPGLNIGPSSSQHTRSGRQALFLGKGFFAPTAWNSKPCWVENLMNQLLSTWQLEFSVTHLNKENPFRHDIKKEITMAISLSAREVLYLMCMLFQAFMSADRQNTTQHMRLFVNEPCHFCVSRPATDKCSLCPHCLQTCRPIDQIKELLTGRNV